MFNITNNSQMFGYNLTINKIRVLQNLTILILFSCTFNIHLQRENLCFCTSCLNEQCNES